MEKNVTQAKSRINRRNYSRISGSLELPNLVEIQTNSYEWFKNEGIKEVFNDVYPISNFNETLTLEFVDCRFDEPKYSVDEAKDRDANYSAPIRATLRLVNNGTGEIKENEVFMGDFPLMTDAGTFIINGAERVIVSQLVRSPGAYFADAMDKSGKTVFTGSMIPSRGTWLEFENDAKDILNAYGNLENIDFCGLLPLDEVYDYYQKSSCLIFPSKLETWGLPISEAKEFDLPMIVADLDYAHETVGIYDKVCFFDPDNAAMLADLMNKAIHNEPIFNSASYVNTSPNSCTSWKEVFDKFE